MRHLLSVFLLCSISSAFRAQDTIATYFDILGNPITNVYSSTFFRSKISSSKPAKTYYWGESTSGNMAFKPSQISKKNGLFVFLNRKGEIFWEISFRDNQLHGEMIKRYEDGKVSERENFKNGVRDSTCTYYHKNGVISSIEIYEEDSLISYTFFSEDGQRDTVSTSTEINAEFPGGFKALTRYLADSIQYPQTALELGIEGKCFLQFQVDETGKISDIQVMRGVPDCPECDAESVRVVKAMPDWTPSKMHNRYCSSIFNLPISFKLWSPDDEVKKKRRKK